MLSADATALLLCCFLLRLELSGVSVSTSCRTLINALSLLVVTVAVAAVSCGGRVGFTVVAATRMRTAVS